MVRIEVYSQDYDDNENVINNGLNGKAFVSDMNDPRSQYECYNIVDAMDMNSFDQIAEFVLYYQKNGVQYFKRFKCS